jgi:hypothetical protein
MKNTGLLVLCMMFVVISCTKDENGPLRTKAFGRLEIVKGDNQSGFFGESLNDSIVIKASSYNNHRRYLIKYEMIQGNGEIYSGLYSGGQNLVEVDSSGILKMQWRLGCNANTQKVRFVLYVDSTHSSYNYYNYYSYFSEASDSVTISASAVRPNGWGRSCGCEIMDMYRTRIISYDGNTLYLISRGLYSSTDQGLNWNKVEGIPDWGDIVDARFNSLGWLYILTDQHGISFSKDFKQWDYINNGILDYRNPTAFLVEDSALFVSFYFDGPYKTTNNGGFWRKLLVGGVGEDRYYSITRHPNGDIYLFDKWDDVWVSKTYGTLWSQLNIDFKYTSGIIYDLNIDRNGSIYIGGNDATISVLDPTTYQGEVHRYYQYNGSSQEIINIQIQNDNVYYLVRGNPRSGVYSMSNNWDLINSGFNKDIIYYYLKSDNTFMLLSYDGLYNYYSN